jgi:CRP/FNR family cyclic AMP-dependent transcriptional regulator
MPLRECSSSPVDKSSSRTAAPLNVCSKEPDQVGGRSPRSGLAEGRGQQGIQVRPALLYPSIGAAGSMIEAGLGETAAAFVSSSPWGRKLERLDLERVLDSTKERIVPKRGAVVRASSVAQFWVGIISGLVVQSVTNSDGHASFLSAASDGAWFGEGTLMKRERWGYDVVALQETRVALIPLATFEWLRETNLPFNHFVQALQDARLSTFTGMLVSTRHSSTEGRVATALANLFNLRLYQRSDFIRISQSELAMLAGTSRQRANAALKRLHELGLVQPRRQGVEVIDLEGLRSLAAPER